MRSSLIFLLFLVATPGIVVAQSWRDDYKNAQEAFNKENVDEAFTLADASLKAYLAQDGKTNDNYAAILRLLSTISFAQSRYPEGLEYATKEIVLREQKKDTTYAIALVNRALFEEQLEKYQQAVTGLIEARKIFVASYPATHPQIQECDLRLAINYYLSGDLTSAEKYLEPLLKMADGGFEAWYYGALIYKEGGKYANAEEQFGKAQTSYESELGKSGEGYFGILQERAINFSLMGKQEEADKILNQLKAMPDATNETASLLNFTAGVYQSRGEFAKAGAMYDEALVLLKGNDAHTQKMKGETLQNRAMLLAEQNQYDAALKDLAAARALLENSKSSRYLGVLNRLGDVYAQSGRWTEAESSYRQALDGARKMNPKPADEETLAMVGIASTDAKKGKFTRADSTYESIIRNYESGGRIDAIYIRVINSLASSRQSQGQWTSARILTYKAAAMTARKYGRPSGNYGQALENLALLNMRLGDLTSAKAEIDSSLNILEKTSGKESVPYANVLLSLGRYYQITGDYTRAEPHLKHARDIIRTKQGEQSDDYALALNSLALLYQTMGNYRDAEPLLTTSKGIIEKKSGKLNAEYATAVQNLATLYQLEGKYVEAEPLLREAMETDRQILGENHPQYAITLQNLATLYQKLGKYDQAQQMLERVLVSSEKALGKEHPSYATTLSNLAALYQDRGQFEKAEVTWKQSVELRKRILGENHPDYARSLYGLAGVYHGLNQLDKAKMYYEPVVEKYQKQVQEFFPSLSEKEKSAFYTKIKPVFDSYQDFCVQYLLFKPEESGKTLEQLYDLQLSTKAILLNASNKVRSRIQESGNKELQSQFREWLGLKESIVRAYNYSQEERLKMNVDLPALESKANDLEKRLSAESDVFRNQFEKETVTWKSVQQMLKEDEAAVEIIRIKKKYVKDSVYYVALTLKKSDSHPMMALWKQGTQLETKRFKYHRNTIKFHFADTLSYYYYWEPLVKPLQKVTTVYLSCDGVFNKVNFNSIFNPASHHFLIDDYTIRQVSNTRELTEKKKARSSSQSMARLFGFADFNLAAKNTVGTSNKRSPGRAFSLEGEDIPVLPATEKEVDKIQVLLTSKTWDVKSYKKSEATEEHLKQLESPRLIHIATHGFFLSDVDVKDDERAELAANPLFRSGVLLAGAGVERSALQNEEDGVLTAYEAMNLNLDRTDLVVLSACETGLGEVRNGEGVYGLQRSFLVAGASTVMMSLWQVDDVATQELMNAFYSNWVSGADQHVAFRNAQLEMKDKYKEPYFWGAFVLIGF